jgi:hypothetical protein
VATVELGPVESAVPPLVTAGGVAVFELTLYVTVVLWERPPLVPVMVTVYVPVAPEQERIEATNVVVLLRVTLVGDNVQVRPVDGDTISDNATVPVNPPRPVTVMVDMPVAPVLTVKLVGLAATVKSWTMKLTVVLWVRPLLLPVTVTV